MAWVSCQLAYWFELAYWFVLAYWSELASYYELALATLSFLEAMRQMVLVTLIVAPLTLPNSL
jgi:hypothetical protein